MINKRIQISFTSLVINVQSILDKGHKIEEFASKYNLPYVENDELLISKEMNTNGINLQVVIQDLIDKEQMNSKNDYVLIKERLIYSVENRPNEMNVDFELEETIHLNWITSIATKEGCYVWKTDFQS